MIWGCAFAGIFCKQRTKIPAQAPASGPACGLILAACSFLFTPILPISLHLSLRFCPLPLARLHIFKKNVLYKKQD